VAKHHRPEWFQVTFDLAVLFDASCWRPARGPCRAEAGTAVVGRQTCCDH
jgi:hypothetical protein